MALALNNLKRVDIPLNKETKPNQTNLIKHQSFVYTQLNVKTVLFQTIQFSMSTQLILFDP